MRRLFLFFGASALFGIQGCHPPSTAAKSHFSKLEITDVKVGDGETAAVGDFPYLEYTGKLADGGQVFDSNAPAPGSDPTKAPFSFRIAPDNGTAGVIAGWNKGVQGMKVGGERILKIPAKLGYGEQAQAKIPANSDLVFDVKLLGLIKPGEEAKYKFKDDKIGTGAQATKNSWVTITYTAELLNGMKIGSSDDDGGKLTFQTVTGEMAGGNAFVPVRGVTFGVIGMKVGGIRTLILPPELGFNVYYRSDNVDSTSVIKYRVTLLGVSDKPPSTPKKS